MQFQQIVDQIWFPIVAQLWCVSRNHLPEELINLSLARLTRGVSKKNAGRVRLK